MNRNKAPFAASLAAICLLVSLPLSACQPTPDNPIVGSGDDSVLNDKIEATALPTPEGTDSIGSSYNFPSSKEDNFKCIDDDVSVSVKAKVSMPLIKSVPVLEIEPVALTSEYIQDFVKKMNPDLKFYENGEHLFSKAELRESIEELQERTSVTLEEYAERYSKDSGEANPDMDKVKEMYDAEKERLEYYKELYKNYPDDPFRFIESDLTIHSASYLPGYEPPEMDDPTDPMQSLNVNGYNADGEKCAFIYLFGNADAKTGNFQYQGPLPDSFEAPKDIDEAIKLDLALLKELGFADTMTPVKTEYYYKSSDPAQQGPFTEPRDTALALDRVEITFKRGFSGVTSMDVLLANNYAAVAENENLTIGAGTDGYFTFHLQNPYKVLSIENENVELLPFDDIYSAFVRQAQVEYTKTYATIGNYTSVDTYEGEIYEGDMFSTWNGTVTGINFGLVHIPIKNGGYRYVPAWQFTGYYSGELNRGETESTENNPYLTTVFMTINAIDGSRITGLYTRSSGS